MEAIYRLEVGMIVGKYLRESRTVHTPVWEHALTRRRKGGASGSDPRRINLLCGVRLSFHQLRSSPGFRRLEARRAEQPVGVALTDVGVFRFENSGTLRTGRGGADVNWRPRTHSRRTFARRVDIHNGSARRPSREKLRKDRRVGGFDWE